MKFIKYYLAFLCLVSPTLLLAQAASIFNDIKLNQSLEDVTEKLSEISESWSIITVETPRFPLADEKEAHLVCSEVKTNDGIISKVVFTFADDKLAYIEARGNVKALTSRLKDTARTYLDYDVFVAEKLFVQKKEDAAWILTEGAMHVNLFTWENPYLNPDQLADTKPDFSNQVPAFLKMGASFDELKSQLEANSNFTNRDELDGSDPNAQFQMNCFGVDYLGFPRKVEARFGDDKLNVVWILTGKGEEDRIREALIDQFGKPIYVNEEWEIFNDWQVGLRKDKPEVLLMEKKIGLDYKTSYFKQ